MGKAIQPLPVKLLVPMLTNEPSLFSCASEILCQRFGPVDYTSTVIPFNHTTYYEAEFGTGLLRCFIAFRDLIDPGSLAEVKQYTNMLEEEMSLAGNRCINLDPGYMSLAKFVLATTKDQSHRIYLGGGIYAEVTCNYRQGAWQPNSWTYPDYRTPEYLAILMDVRRILVKQLYALRRAL